MTVFSYTWNTAFEGIPADNEFLSIGASEIRAEKVSVRERMNVDHFWTGSSVDGTHNVISLPMQASGDPTPQAGFGALYAKFGGASGTDSDLYFKDYYGTVVRLTAGGKPNIAQSGAVPLTPIATPAAGTQVYAKAFLGIAQLFYIDGLSREWQVTGLTGTTAQRPAGMQQGQPYWDTTLSKPIWFDGANWRDATGAIV